MNGMNDAKNAYQKMAAMEARCLPIRSASRRDRAQVVDQEVERVLVLDHQHMLDEEERQGARHGRSEDADGVAEQQTHEGPIASNDHPALRER